MSNNRNFNNNFHGTNFTFRCVPDFPPPPLPPPILTPMRLPFFPPETYYSRPNRAQMIEKEDQDFIKKFENGTPQMAQKYKVKAKSITYIREEIQCLVKNSKDFECKLNNLKDNIDKLPDEDWKKCMDEMNRGRKRITSKLEIFVSSYMDVSRSLLAKRSAKRLRLKRQKQERQIAKKERMKQLEERSRKIDENLQKIKDDILKAQKAEEAKLEADVVLREVRRKKLDAKKYIAKLDDLLKLRKAKENTAKGRGETVSELEAATFLSNVEKLKKLWNQKLLIYNKEEAELHAKLADGMEMGDSAQQMGVQAALVQWREVLFGDSEATPQVDFYGDVHRFVAVRSQWDQYIHQDGTPLPVGWVVPPLEP